MKTKITAIRFYNVSKDGQPLLDRRSRPYQRATIKTEQHGDKWLSGLAYQDSPILKWAVGQEVEIEVKANGQYLNFELPRQNKDISETWAKDIEDAVIDLRGRVKDLEDGRGANVGVALREMKKGDDKPIPF